MSSVIMIGLATGDYYIRRPFEIGLSINKGNFATQISISTFIRTTVCLAHARPRAALAVEDHGRCGTSLSGHTYCGRRRSLCDRRCLSPRGDDLLAAGRGWALRGVL
jgi:hypothetical protein